MGAAKTPPLANVLYCMYSVRVVCSVVGIFGRTCRMDEKSRLCACECDTNCACEGLSLVSVWSVVELPMLSWVGGIAKVVETEAKDESNQGSRRPTWSESISVLFSGGKNILALGSGEMTRSIIAVLRSIFGQTDEEEKK